jgi:hypothetical protein
VGHGESGIRQVSRVQTRLRMYEDGSEYRDAVGTWNRWKEIHKNDSHMR